MMNIPHHLAALAATLWVGGLWAIGYLAGQMFMTIGYVGIICATYLLLHRLVISGKAVLRQPLFLVIASTLVISLVIQFGIQPLMTELKVQALPLDVMQSALADRFKLWHGVSSILYLLESLLGAVLVIKSFHA